MDITPYIGQDVTLVPLSNSPEFFVIDTKDFPEVNKHNWYLVFRELKATQIVSKIKGKSISIIRFLTKLRYQDHKNKNIFDNRNKNIRDATFTQQGQNQGTRKNKLTSIYKGVWRKTFNKWEVAITINKEKVYLGLFKCEIQAALAYDKAARLYFKEFAVCNFYIT